MEAGYAGLKVRAVIRPFLTEMELALGAASVAISRAGASSLAELAAMRVRTSQYNPDHEIPEKNWLYRLAKRFWFNDFGVYRGYDHRATAAPALASGAASARR